VSDNHSQFPVASDALVVFKAADVVASFHRAASAHDFPASMLSDNGAVFTAAPRGGRCAMELETAALGISYRHSTPYHPQTCGKVERFHQTEKKWSAKHAPPADIGELQAQIDRFVAYYNEIRPHRALGRRTPAQAFTARPKARPMLPGFVVPPHYRIRRDKVDITGVITLRHNSRLHRARSEAHWHPGPRVGGRSSRPSPDGGRRAAAGPHLGSEPRLPTPRAA